MGEITVYKCVYVCENCGKVYNKQLEIDIPVSCKRCGLILRNAISLDYGNIKRRIAKRTLFGWKVVDRKTEAIQRIEREIFLMMNNFFISGEIDDEKLCELEMMKHRLKKNDIDIK